MSTGKRSKTRPWLSTRKNLTTSMLIAAGSLMLSEMQVQAQVQTTASCSGGQYLYLDMDLAQQGLGFCITCPRGYQCPNPAGTLPLRCNLGQYSGFGADSCINCPAGWYCTTPDTLPVPCPKGQFAFEGSSACAVCSAGTVCKPDGTYEICNPGEYCDNTQVVAEKCPAGYRCPDGKTKVPCTAGSYSSEGQSFCTRCPAGNYCPNLDHTPLECRDGYYQDQMGQQSCTQCPSGKACPSKSSPPEDCPFGYFALRAETQQCTICPAGHSCDGSTAPVPCTYATNTQAYTMSGFLGLYSTEGMMDCISCPAGFECPDQKSKVECTDTGSYSLWGDLHCKTCPPGYSCSKRDKTPILCGKGTYSAAGAESCETCPSGKTCDDPSEIPKDVEEGQTSNAGDDAPSSCPANAVCIAGSAPVFCNESSDDPALKTIVNQMGTACVACPAGMACPQGTWASQEPCKPGYWSEAQTFCQISPAGSYAAKTTAQPQVCADGYFSDVGATSCTSCPPGYSCPDKTGRHNFLCPPGSTYKLGDGTCEPCAAGSFCPIAIPGYRENGHACPVGTVAVKGSYDCEIAKPGWSSDTEKYVAKCMNTQQGTYQVGGSATCSICPKNHECPFGETVSRCPLYFYAENDSSFTSIGCKPCPDGNDCQDFSAEHLNPSTSAYNDPVQCGAGYYSQSLDFYCKACPKGHYCPDAANSLPTKCEAGKYASEGRSSCETCPGDYYSLEGQEYCSPVPEGYEFRQAENSINICAQGTYSRWGEVGCTSCADGFLCPQGSKEGSKFENICPAGSYCIAGVQTKCPAGQFNKHTGASDSAWCVDCPQGYNCQEGTANFELVPCPKGGYCELGKPVVACPAGTFNDQLYGRSISDCFTCPIGHQCGAESKDGGSLCAEGYYCPRGSGDGAFPCPAGTHGNAQQGKKDVNECLPCPPGHYCPEASATPTPAEVGYWSPLPNLPAKAALYLCPPGFYCDVTGMTSYKGKFCDAGYVCPAGSTSATQVACPEGTFSDRRDLHNVDHCEPCPKGYSCEAASTSQTLGAADKIVECPEHKFCPLGTKASKIPICPKGYYAPYTKAKSQNDCIECPAGKYCDQVGVSGTYPHTCQAGHYCPPATEHGDEYPCKPGYYNDLTGSHSISDCLHCGFNKYCPAYGQVTFAYCPSGTYNDATTNAAYCTPCAAGFECNQPGDGNFVYPIPCSKGYYSAKGSKQCIPCPVGTYCPNEATTDEDLKTLLCPLGTFCSSTVSFTPIGGILNAAYPTGIDVYPNKRSQADGGHACAQHKYCPEGTQKELDIPRGTMQALYARGGLVDAIQMPAGSYSAASGAAAPAAPYVTTLCDAGHYCPPGSYEPVPCPSGTFRINTGGKDVDSCGPCAAGTYCPSTGTVTPTPCIPGHFCPEGAAEAQACPRGTYYAGTGLYDSRGCAPCDAGYYCPLMGMIAVDTVNNECDAGYYCKGGSSRPEPTDDTTGSRCPAGGYCQKGGSSPSSCPRGQYGPFEGARANDECVDCKPGYVCLGTDASEASNQCPAGYICAGGVFAYDQWNDGSDPDVNASITQPGEYAPAGSAIAQLCPEGQYTGDTQRGECDYCTAGYFCNQIGTTKDVSAGPKERPECEKGYWCPAYESFSVSYTYGDLYRQIACIAGTYNDVAASTSIDACIQCEAGYACEREAIADTSEFVKCAAGYFCKSGASTRYPDGATSSLSGPCPKGHYCEEQTEDPEPCPAGTFSPQERATSVKFCLPCPPGYLCVDTGMYEAVILMDAGQFGDDGLTTSGCGSTGTTGVYCPIGSHFELYCPMGFYQPDQNQGKCSECSAGNYCMVGIQEQCESGYYCS